jgi:hypothetical protein
MRRPRGIIRIPDAGGRLELILRFYSFFVVSNGKTTEHALAILVEITTVSVTLLLKMRSLRHFVLNRANTNRSRRHWTVKAREALMIFSISQVRDPRIDNLFISSACLTDALLRFRHDFRQMCKLQPGLKYSVWGEVMLDAPSIN